jgi:ADP-heptose:LPS heptosyltransferase
LETIKDDLSRWEKDGPEYHYYPVLFLNIGGGLGDQVCAEPVIRYIRSVLYPLAEIYAISAYPELFGHIEGVVVDSKMPDKKFDAVYSIDLHPDKKTPHNQYTINTLSHPVDYISLTALKRILPVNNKQIRLGMWGLGKEEISSFYCDLEQLVIVHPGQGWESKTFPLEWWQAVIDGLAEAGYRVGIIGKSIGGEHGFLNVSIPENGVDFRDKLSTFGLMALLKYAPVLISNDSAPIHIAGAFDNWIILIPTCKHPEHLLPYRNGSIWHKATALYKDLACEDYRFRPTDVEVHSITTTVKPIKDYLPDPQEVIKTVKNMIARDSALNTSWPIKPKGEYYECHDLQPN